MDNCFNKLKEYLLELEYNIVSEDAKDNVFVISREEEGIKNMIVALAEPILIIEQQLFEIKQPTMEMYQSLLKKNRDIIHGAFVIDDSGKKVIFRDTLQIENLDLNELEGSINSLSLLLSEYSTEIMKFSV